MKTDFQMFDEEECCYRGYKVETQYHDYGSTTAPETYVSDNFCLCWRGNLAKKLDPILDQISEEFGIEYDDEKVLTVLVNTLTKYL